MSEQNDRNKKGLNPDEVTLKNAREVLKRILAENEKLSKGFQEEMNIKNDAFAFILTNGMLDEYAEYIRGIDTSKPGGHRKAVNWLLMQLPENTN